MLRADEIAGSHPRLALFVMGTNDLVKEHAARAIRRRASR